MLVTILYGLPGSGKTTYAESVIKSQKNARYGKVRMIHGDSYLGKKNMADAIAESVCSYKHVGMTEVIVDSLITTNNHLEILLSKLVKASDQYDGLKKEPLTFQVVCWAENREACLWNDRGRRKVNSKITIENAPFEIPSKEVLDKFKAKLIMENVEKKPGWQVWAHEVAGKDSLHSSRWSLGGSYGTCWDDIQHPVDAEPAPASFEEFDSLIEQICPNITFMQYRRIYGDCVTTETDGESDYYGGHVNYAYFKCDLNKLYESLIERELIERVIG